LNEVAKRKNVNVIRQGKVLHMNVYELLVGDVVQVETGEIISVDGIVIEANRLSVDESSMTGETNSVKKNIY
jgi:P-type E1-E2 ATPase